MTVDNLILKENFMEFNRKIEILELNPTNVLSIYQDCLVPQSDIGKDPENELRVKIFRKEVCGKDSPEIVFSGRQIHKHTNTIHYLLGQLKVTHEHFKRIYTCYGVCGLYQSTLD